MSLAANCPCPCPTGENVQVPGPDGDPGEAGAPGVDGVNAFSEYLNETSLTIPAIGDPVISPASLNFDNIEWVSVGQTVFLSDGTKRGTFTVDSVTGSTVLGLTFLGANGDSAPGDVIATGAKLSPAGAPSALSAALPTALTDNLVGTASDTIAVGGGQHIHSVYFRAAAITGNVLLYTYTPSFAFKIIRISASIVDAITTGAKAATLTTAIAGTPTTGGVVVLSGTYALGTEQASSVAITAANTGTSAQAITITASVVTAFVEGGFMLNIQMQNTDTSNALKSLAAKVNALRTSLS